MKKKNVRINDVFKIKSVTAYLNLLLLIQSIQ